MSEPIFVKVGTVIFDLNAVVHLERKNVLGVDILDAEFSNGVVHRVPAGPAVDRIWLLFYRRVVTATEPDRE